MKFFISETYGVLYDLWSGNPGYGVPSFDRLKILTSSNSLLFIVSALE